MTEQKKVRPRWCPKCRELRPWQKVRTLGARASFRACLECGGRTNPRKPGQKKAKPREGSFTALLRECDDLARARARERITCEIEDCCATRETAVMEWAHGLSRSHRAIRHIDYNGRLLCRRHHSIYSQTRMAEDWRIWLMGKIGAERFTYLVEHRHDRVTVAGLMVTRDILQARWPVLEATL